MLLLTLCLLEINATVDICRPPTQLTIVASKAEPNHIQHISHSTNANLHKLIIHNNQLTNFK